MYHTRFIHLTRRKYNTFVVVGSPLVQRSRVYITYMHTDGRTDRRPRIVHASEAAVSIVARMHASLSYRRFAVHHVTHIVRSMYVWSARPADDALQVRLCQNNRGIA
jgi:hypothetical protein